MGFHISKSLKEPKPEDYLNIFQQLQADKLKEKNLIGQDEPLKDYNYLLSLDKSHTDIEYEQLEDNKIKPKEDITLAEFMIVNTDKLSELLGDNFYIYAANTYMWQGKKYASVNIKEVDDNKELVIDKPIGYFRDSLVDSIEFSDYFFKQVTISLLPIQDLRQLKATDFK